MASTVRSLRGSADHRPSSRRRGSRATALRRPALALASRRSLRPRGGWAGRRTRWPASSRRRPPGSSASASERSRTASPASSAAEGGRSRRVSTISFNKPQRSLARLTGSSSFRRIGVEIFAAAHRGASCRRATARAPSSGSPREPHFDSGFSKMAQTAATKRIAKARQNARSGGRRCPPRRGRVAAGHAHRLCGTLLQARFRCALIERSVGLNRFEAQAPWGVRKQVKERSIEAGHIRTESTAALARLTKKAAASRTAVVSSDRRS